MWWWIWIKPGQQSQRTGPAERAGWSRCRGPEDNLHFDDSDEEEEEEEDDDDEEEEEDDNDDDEDEEKAWYIKAIVCN